MVSKNVTSIAKTSIASTQVNKFQAPWLTQNESIMYLEPHYAVITSAGIRHSASVGCTAEIIGICLVTPPDKPEPSIFGFAEFVTALALLIVVYTFSDIRYRFRVSTAPISLFKITFAAAIVVGIGTLTNDVWFSEKWPVPDFASSQALWQGFFGWLFLMAVLVWVYYGFLRPPVFGPRNCLKFARAFFRHTLTGSEEDLPAIVGELARSAPSLIKHSRITGPQRNRQKGIERNSKPPKPKVGDYAHDILLMLGSRKVCRYIASSAPGTAIALFNSMGDQKKYNVPLGQFAKNLTMEALKNKDSIIYHEDDGYFSGFLGYLRPFSTAIYGRYEIVESLGDNFHSPLDIDYQLVWSWDSSQMEAYCRLVLIAMRSYLEEGWRGRSFALRRSIENIRNSVSDIYKLNGQAGDVFTSDSFQRLRPSVRFVSDCARLLDELKIEPWTRLRKLDGRHAPYEEDIYDVISELMFEIIFSASGVHEPVDTCWSVHYNAVWGEFFGLPRRGSSWQILHFKVRRLLYNEIRELSDLPNYKSSAILGICLNVMGLNQSYRRGNGSEWPLKKVVLGWAKKNYLKLLNVQPDVAASCLIGGISFDEGRIALVKTYNKGLSLEAPKDFLELEPVS